MQNRFCKVVWAFCTGGAVLLLLLSGCATLNKEECFSADWQMIGYEDGARGHKISRIGLHRQACSKHGVSPDFDLYELGHQQGLKEWCTSRNAYKLGLSGARYNGVCMDMSESAFLSAYNQGREVFLYQKEVKRQEDELRNMMTRNYDIEKEIQKKEAELVAKGVSTIRRKQLLREIRQLEDDYSYQMERISDKEHVVDNMKNKLAQMQAWKPY